VLPFYTPLNINVKLSKYVVPYGINGRVWDSGVLNLKQMWYEFALQIRLPTTWREFGSFPYTRSLNMLLLETVCVPWRIWRQKHHRCTKYWIVGWFSHLITDYYTWGWSDTHYQLNKQQLKPYLKYLNYMKNITIIKYVYFQAKWCRNFTTSF
jgi:hypothetical protein